MRSPRTKVTMIPIVLRGMVVSFGQPSTCPRTRNMQRRKAGPWEESLNAMNFVMA
jgi:hypothetical protein